MTSYVDTLVIDCNRKTSEQAKSFNTENQPAVFTCRQGAGIKLNPGDQVSLHSAMINEKGNNGNVEFSGEVVDDPESSYTLEETHIHNYWDTSNGQPWGYGNQLYYPFQQATSVVNIQKTFELKDNEANIEINYYKNANGQGYYHLPRRFDMPNPRVVPHGVGNPSEFDDQHQMYLAYTGNGATNPVPNPIVPQHDNQNFGMNRCPPRDTATCSSDMTYYARGASIRNAEQTGTMGYKYKNNNDRFTIYFKTRQYWDINSVNSTDMGGGSAPPGPGYDPVNHFYTEGNFANDEMYPANVLGDFTPKLGRDPASMNTWVRYKEIKNIKVSKGYSTPTEIAEQITDQLNETQNPKPLKAVLGTPPIPTSMPTTYSVKQESQCLKSFFASNHNIMSNVNWDDYSDGAEGAGDGGQAGNTTAEQVLGSQKEYVIGVKRPELWDAGRDLYYDQLVYPGRLTETTQLTGTCRKIDQWTILPGVNILRAYVQPPVVPTTIPWTKENLIKFRDFFKVQQKYPELFDYTYNYRAGANFGDYPMFDLQPNNSCFLHIDTRGSTTALATRYLGNDDYETHADAINRFGDSDSQGSHPIWFDYYPEYKDNEHDCPVDADTLTYGYFKKWIDGNGQEWIAFNTKGIGGLPDTLFDTTPNARLDATMTIGYDWHFNAYGTSCIALYSGYLNADYDGKTEFAGGAVSGTAIQTPVADFVPIYPFMRDYYCGSNQVELGFDQDGGRFYIHQLHSPELVGNDWDAGSSASTEPVVDAGDQVYKVNKRLGAYNFTPTMVPYEPSIDSSNNHPKDPASKIPISVFNWNFEPWTIFDADSGIFIQNFGVKREFWSKSLWGKLGFSYNQFDVSENTLNKQTRLNDLVNLTSIGGITTNANIDPGDMTQWVSNTFSAPMEINMLPSIQYPGQHQNAPSNWMKEVLPAITTKQMSVKITAEGLPTKMKNAYYLVRSDIVGDTNYMVGDEEGDGQLMPIVGVVNKENGFGDYYFQTGTQLSFTITKPTTITRITTSIHDPDMKVARVDDNCAVLYKIQKTNNGNYLIGDELIKKAKSNLGK